MTTLSVSDNIGGVIHRHRLADNGFVPNPRLYNALAVGVDRAGFYLGKCLFRAPGNLKAIPAAGGTRRRWRVAFHTGKFTKGIYVVMVMAKSVAAAPAGRFYLDLVDTVTFQFGAAVTTPNDTPDEFGHFTNGLINCSPDSDYTGYFEDVDDGRLITGAIFELKESLDTDNGYAPLGNLVGQPIFDTLRAGIAPLATQLWESNGATAASWASSTTGRTRTSTTDINIIDSVSTTVSATTPGFTLDNRYRNTSSKTTVPYVFKAYSKVAAGNGHVYLKNSAGTVLATLTTTSTTGAWISTTVQLPNTEAKFDVQFDGDGTNLHTVDSVFLYENA